MILLTLMLRQIQLKLQKLKESYTINLLANQGQTRNLDA